MNRSAKGRRAEYRSRRLLEGEGFVVVRSAASKGAFDLIGLRADALVLVQTKCNRAPSPAERAKLAAFPCPPGTIKMVHVWRDQRRAPDVREV